MGKSRFHIGASLWPGLSKLIEEMGELTQVIGKLYGTEGQRRHFDGTDLKRRFEDELADLKAAIDFVEKYNPQLNSKQIERRRKEKLERFNKWHGKPRHKN